MSSRKMSLFTVCKILFLSLAAILVTACNHGVTEIYSSPEYAFVSQFSLSHDESTLLVEVAEDYNWNTGEGRGWQWVLFTRTDGEDSLYSFDQEMPNLGWKPDWGKGTLLYYEKAIPRIMTEYVAMDMESGDFTAFSKSSFPSLFQVSKRGEYLVEYEIDGNDLLIMKLPEFELSQEISLPADVKIRDLAWSYDDTRLMVYAQATDAVLLEVDAQSGAVTNVTGSFFSDIAFDNSFDWHSGEELVLTQDSNDVVSIFDLSLNCQITSFDLGSVSWHPAWSATGNAIWVIRRESIFNSHRVRLVLYDLTEALNEGRELCN
jgi:hypothetical protein